MKGVLLTDRLAFLEGTFKRFGKNLTTYAEAMDWEDLPHFYNERATLSFFAAACWQSKLIAIEEFIARKGRGDTKGNGRCDLWLYDGDVDWGVAIEAKQKWPTLNTRTSSVATWLDEGDADARRNYDAGIRASMTMVVPQLPKDCAPEDGQRLVNRIVEAAVRYGIHGLYWWFPQQAIEHCSVCRNTGELQRWPGLLVLTRIASVYVEGRVPKRECLEMQKPIFRLPEPV